MRLGGQEGSSKIVLLIKVEGNMKRFQIYPLTSFSTFSAQRSVSDCGYRPHQILADSAAVAVHDADRTKGK